MTKDPGQTSPTKKNSWKRFQKLSIDRNSLKKRAAKLESSTVSHARELVFRRLDNIRYVRRHIVTWFMVVAAIMIGIATQFGLSSREFTETAAVSGGTYVEGVVGAIESLNPLQASTSAEVAASQLMFSSLYKYDQKGRLKLDLAQNLSSNDDGTVYTVKIRENAVWHDGRPVTAEDVVFTINTIKDPETRSRSSLRANWRDITAEVLNQFTVKFTLPAYAAFPHALTFPVVPKHLLSNMPPGAIPESAFASEPVGSGPFVYRFLQNSDIASQHRTLHMTANSDYYKSIPRLSRFELSAYPDETSLLDALRRREVTAGAGISSETAASINTAQYNVSSYTLDSGVYLLINTTSDILRDRNVRHALQVGLDVGAVRAAANEGLKPLGLPVLASHLPDAKLPSPPKHDMARAKKILDDAGWKLSGDVRKKRNNQLELELTTIKGQQFERVVDEISRQAELLGIKVTKQVIDDRQPGSNFRQNILQQRNYEMLVYELPIGADPDVYAYWHSSQLGVSGYNFTNYSNGVSDAALVSARDRSEVSLRSAKYVTFAEQWLKDAPAIGLYQQAFYYAVSANAQTLRDDTQLVMSSDRYGNVEQWTVGRGPVYKTP